MAKHEKKKEKFRSYEFDSDALNRELAEKAFSLEEFDLAKEGNERPLAYIEEALNKEIIGQEAAVESLITALYRENFRNPNRPITVLMFLGPTGVGKSETAKVLSRLLHDSEDALVSINCSEISENHRVSALLGASPEYVGREQAPLLDRKKIERPRSVVLFDEIEKGAPALRDLLLQICDNGEVTLLKDGKPVSFKNSIVIMTSNIGAADMQKVLNPQGLGFHESKSNSRADDKRVENAAIKALLGSGVMRPELINRIDEKIVFKPLSDEQLEQVLENYIDKTNPSYHKNGFHMTISPELRRELVMSCDKGDEDRRLFSARPIISKYKKLVEGLVARKIATGGIRPGSHVHTTVVSAEDADVPLQDRIGVYHKRSEAFVRPARRTSGDEADHNGEAVTYSTINNRSTAVGLAAAAGVAALLLGDYMNSRRSRRA